MQPIEREILKRKIAIQNEITNNPSVFYKQTLRETDFGIDSDFW